VPEPKEGTVIAEGGKFFLDLAGHRLEIVPQLAGGVENLKGLAGQKVDILYSEPARFVAGLQVARRPPILCYVPPITFGHQQELELPGGSAALASARNFHIAIQDPAGIKRPVILCYVPAPEVIAGIEAQVRQNVAKQLLQQGYINQEVYDKVAGGRTT
jgi:hypothetical protein